MGLGQTMLTMMFLVLLSVAALTSYNMIIDQETNFYEQEAYKQAATLANSLIQEVRTKRFDEKDTASYSYRPVTDFTTSGNLGPDPVYSYYWWGGAYISDYESSNVPLPDSIRTSTGTYRSVRSGVDIRYDDIDDYNGYIRNINVNSSLGSNLGFFPGFTLTAKVCYVDSTNYDIESANRTYYKKVEVTVSNSKYLKNNLVYKSIIAY